jgi:hypothetical protein
VEGTPLFPNHLIYVAPLSSLRFGLPISTNVTHTFQTFNSACCLTLSVNGGLHISAFLYYLLVLDAIIWCLVGLAIYVHKCC